MTLYMKTTRDKYEFPIAVADSPKELAQLLGTSAEAVSSSLSHNIRGWHRIECPDEWYPTNDGQLWRYLPDGTVEYRD